MKNYFGYFLFVGALGAKFCASTAPPAAVPSPQPLVANNTLTPAMAKQIKLDQALLCCCFAKDGQEAVAEIELLLQAGANPSVTDKMGQTPLSYARKKVFGCSCEVMRLLRSSILLRRATPKPVALPLTKEEQAKLNSVLCDAVVLGDAQYYQHAKEHGYHYQTLKLEELAKWNGAGGLDGSQDAIDINLIDKILAAGANPNTLFAVPKFDYLNYPLEWVTIFYRVVELFANHNYKVNKDAVLAFLRHGADPNIKNLEYDTDVYYYRDNPSAAILQGKTALHKVLLPADGTDADWTSLHEIVNALLAHGANPNLGDEDGKTPLHYAAILDDLEVVKSLLANKANPFLQDRYGRKASDYAKDAALDFLIEAALKLSSSR